MKSKTFDAGALKHRRLITLMQMIVAFLTAIVLGLIFSPAQIEFPVDKNTVIVFLIVAIVIVLIGFNYILGKLERTLGWKEEEMEEKTKNKNQGKK
jgi:undecaprenyl pyrophosphate phosphatase UppP